MNENIKTKLKSFLVLWVIALAYIVATGKQEILLVAVLLAGAVLVYFPVNIKEMLNKNLDKGDKHDN